LLPRDAKGDRIPARLGTVLVWITTARQRRNGGRGGNISKNVRKRLRFKKLLYSGRIIDIQIPGFESFTAFADKHRANLIAWL
jgi:hypothetical protein